MNEFEIDLGSDGQLLLCLQELMDAMAEAGVCHDGSGLVPPAVISAQYALAANGGDPVLMEVDAAAGFCGDQAMLTATESLLAWIDGIGPLDSYPHALGLAVDVARSLVSSKTTTITIDFGAETSSEAS